MVKHKSRNETGVRFSIKIHPSERWKAFRALERRGEFGDGERCASFIKKKTLYRLRRDQRITGRVSAEDTSVLSGFCFIKIPVYISHSRTIRFKMTTLLTDLQRDSPTGNKKK